MRQGRAYIRFQVWDSFTTYCKVYLMISSGSVKQIVKIIICWSSIDYIKQPQYGWEIVLRQRNLQIKFDLVKNKGTSIYFPNCLVVVRTWENAEDIAQELLMMAVCMWIVYQCFPQRLTLFTAVIVCNYANH